MSLSKILSAKALNDVLKTNSASLRILDCTYQVGPKPDPKEFREKYYGKFDELFKRNSVQRQTYLKSHIPTARHFDLDLAMYPGRFERFSLYEPEVFQRYAQLLGIYRDDQIVLYGRGPFGGMLFSSRSYWLFKAYGHKEISILNGGLEAWTKAGYETETLTEMPKWEKGNWLARDCRHKNITFEELTEKDVKQKDILEKHDEFNLLDTRLRVHFNNEQECGLNAFVVPGCRIPGTHNVPSNELVGPDGLLLPQEEIKTKLSEAGFDEKKPTITYCNTGMQASLLSTILDDVYPNAPIRLYNGSLKEMEIRAPERISDGVTPIAAS
jgi:thiosulfate/3-mercaptopyruvate sulfurtransferase